MKIQSINQIGNKNLYVCQTAAGITAAVSYNTIIAASQDGITYLTSYNYSNTTAHHKTQAVRIFNDTEIITVTPDALYKIADGDKTAATEALQEHEIREVLLQELHNNDSTGKTLKHLQYLGVCKPEKVPESQDFKNGNRLTKYYYKVNFKYVPPVRFQKNSRGVLTDSSKGKYFRYKKQIVNIEE